MILPSAPARALTITRVQIAARKRHSPARKAMPRSFTYSLRSGLYHLVPHYLEGGVLCCMYYTETMRYLYSRRNVFGLMKAVGKQAYGPINRLKYASPEPSVGA